jgi:SAM-dependent methyltransferase
MLNRLMHQPLSFYIQKLMRNKYAVSNRLIAAKRLLKRQSTGTLAFSTDSESSSGDGPSDGITLAWHSKGTKTVEVRIGAPDGQLFSRSGPRGRAVAGNWVNERTVFFLQDVSDGEKPSSQNTLSKLAMSSPSLSNHGTPLVGKVNFGDLRRLKPISNNWGIDRGLPIDRYYIENFLAQHANDIQGHVLEIGDDRYTRMFGKNRLEKIDILNLKEGGKQTTIVADLTKADNIPSNTFDCIICTQTLQLIYDVKAAINTLHRILKPEGVLLATFPGISQTYDNNWSKYWCWNFTTYSARKLFQEIFHSNKVKISSWGNVFSSLSFLQGLSVEDIGKSEIEYYDPGYGMLIAVRALKEKLPTNKNATNPEFYFPENPQIDSPPTISIKVLLDREGSDKGNWYGDLYDVLLRPIRQEIKCLIEIGIGTMLPDAPSSMVGWAGKGYRPGGSLRAWRDFLPNANIHGFDIAPDTNINDYRIISHFCDSTDPIQVSSELIKHQIKADIIIDDGLHTGHAQLSTLKNFFPALRPGGLYIIEDVIQQCDIEYLQKHLLLLQPDASQFVYHTSETWSAIVIRSG